MRIKGLLGGDGGNFDCSNLFYLSIHTLDSQQGIQYAKSRVAREILDAWLAKKISFDGKKYDDSEVSLNDQDEAGGLHVGMLQPIRVGLFKICLQHFWFCLFQLSLLQAKLLPFLPERFHGLGCTFDHAIISHKASIHFDHCVFKQC